MTDPRTEHQTTARTLKLDRVARIAADGTGDAKRMAQMAVDEFSATYRGKS